MIPLISIDVPGVPRAKGSMRARIHRHDDGRPYASLTNDNPLTKEWQHRISFFARAAMKGRTPVTTACRVEAMFLFDRPESDLLASVDPATGFRRLAKGVSEAHVRKPDVDKVLRALLDALTSVCYVDDCQVDQVLVSKVWNTGIVGAGVRVRVYYFEPLGAMP